MLKPYQVFAFIFFCALSIGAFSLLLDKFSGNNAKYCNSILALPFCLQYFTPEDVLGFRDYVDEKEQIRQDSIMAAEEAARKAAILAEISNSGDSIRILETEADYDSIRFWLPENDRSYWEGLFVELERSHNNKKNFRILHYGDSQIEMDRMTEVLRSELQKKFGGGGPGLIVPLPLVPSYTVNQTQSDNWQKFISYGLSSNRTVHRNYGFGGTTYNFTGGSASMHFSLRNRSDSLLNNYQTLKILFGRLAEAIDVELHYTNRAERETIYPDEYEQLQSWNVSPGSKSFNLTFKGDSTCEILGVMLDRNSGVAVDNIAWRGSSGLTFRTISKSSLINTYKLLNVRMVILQFGGNSVPYFHDSTDVIEYVSAFAKQIDYIQSVDSTLHIMVIGPADMSVNQKGEMVTYPLLRYVIEQMRVVSNKHSAAFWSQYHAMGGENSMVRWVESKPVLAAPDYLHFSKRGADILSEKLFISMMREYEIYKLRKQLNEKKIWHLKDSIY